MNFCCAGEGLLEEEKEKCLREHFLERTVSGGPWAKLLVVARPGASLRPGHSERVLGLSSEEEGPLQNISLLCR